MSENLVETSSSESFTSLLCPGDGRTVENIYRHPAQLCLRDGNLAFGDPASSQTSWTDEKHSLYLNFIENAFVTSLYDQGYYGKRWQADRGEMRSVNTHNLTEEGEHDEPSAHPEESQSESEVPESHPDVVIHSNSCGTGPSKTQDSSLGGRTKKRKSESGFKGGLEWAKHSSEHGTATSEYRGRRQITQNRQASQHSAKILRNRQEDQVVPWMKDPRGRQEVRL